MRARRRVGGRGRKAKGRTIICWATQNREKRLQSINSYTILCFLSLGSTNAMQTIQYSQPWLQS